MEIPIFIENYRLFGFMLVFKIVLIPVISAFIGYLTNKAAIWMLFYPKNPKRFLWITFQGIFPKRQKDIAERVGGMVAENLLSPHDIRSKIFTPAHKNEARLFVEGKLNDYLDNEFREKYPWLSLFVGVKSRDKIRHEVLSKLDNSIDNLDENFTYYMEQRVDVKEIIADKINGLDSDEVNELMLKIMKDELQFIEWIGAILGFIIGLLQLGFLLID